MGEHLVGGGMGRATVRGCSLPPVGQPPLPSPRERAAWGGREGPPRAVSRDAAEEASITSEASSVKWAQDSPRQVVAG